MKIIAKDNFDRESVNDKLVASGLVSEWAQMIAAALNAYRSGPAAPVFFVAVDDDYVLHVYDPNK